ncbi:MAG: NADPH-dependent 7-cyano-7-deazaguanine reductase QueF [Rhodocyclaceae bacterium]|jgi:7-cyano-7-deazaguanine reductase|nr:NADPH-dependent 7-cyano-7-deazaguanine reductase QueF [Rhodocyclaceae bacterium]
MQPSSIPPTPGAAEHSPLGRTVAYRTDYAPELLFPIPRQTKRDELGIAGDALPFTGWDLWNAYELSWLTPRGKPVVALGEFRVPAESPCLVESKSLKLYLNSFNQTVFDSIEAARQTIIRDLSAAVGAPVRAVLKRPQDANRAFGPPPGGVLLDDMEVDIQHYQPAPQLLCATGPVVEETLYSHLLKSNCLVTGQPDWASLAIRYRGPAIHREGLLAYIVSFREHHEFHEQCVERVFRDITAHCRPEGLAVWARYTRRGGLDINPFRSRGCDFDPDNLADVRQ